MVVVILVYVTMRRSIAETIYHSLSDQWNVTLLRSLESTKETTS